MDTMKYLFEIAFSLNNPELQKWKQGGGRVMGTVCSNIPEEALYAAGILPVRLRAPGLDATSNADSRMHRINCSYVRSVLELALRGDLAFLDGVITTNTCDHMLRLSAELEEKAGLAFSHYFSMHHALVESSEEWYSGEMRQMLRALEQATGKPISEDDLKNSIRVYNRTRELMRRVNELRRNEPPALTGAEYLRLVLAGMSTPREWFNEQLEALLPALQKRAAVNVKMPRLMIVGGACDSPDFIDFIEQKGAVVVADNLCFGMRHYDGIIAEDDPEPIRAITRRYLNRAACPSIFNALEHNCAMYRRIVRDWRVDAIVCARLKFCDHWGGARKLLAEEFRRDNLPLLDLEREYATAGSGQISTRVQAFLEMLKG